MSTVPASPSLPASPPGVEPADAHARNLDRAVRLNDAAVALIEPLMTHAPADVLGRNLAAAIQQCAASADGLGLRSLNYLAALVTPFLRQRAQHGLTAGDRGCVEQWIGDVVAFCGGQLPGNESSTLVTSLSDWPGFPKVPPQFVELIGERLRADALTIAQWHRAMGAPSIDNASIAVVTPLPAADRVEYAEPPAPVEAPVRVESHESGLPPEPVASVAPPVSMPTQSASGQSPVAGESAVAGSGGSVPVTPAIVVPVAPSVEPASASAASTSQPAAQPIPQPIPQPADEPVPSAPVTVARDELDMLAEASEMLGADVVPQLLSMPLPEVGESAGLEWQELLEEVETRVGHLSNAAGFIGVDGLVRLLASLSDQLRAWRLYGVRVNEDTRRLVMLTPDALARYFRSPQQDRADELAGLMADQGWPQPLTIETCASLADSLGRLTVIDSRQISVDQRELNEDDLSLQIPTDAERSVVEHLLNELPVLSAGFGDAIEALRGGSMPALAQAQRLAHTLKGSANTVGVRGIANLTHRLEDILQLLVNADRLPSRLLGDHLAEAGDCLAQMCEAVAGQGAAPAESLDIYRRSVEWMQRLLDSDFDDPLPEPSPARTGATLAPAPVSLPAAAVPDAPVAPVAEPVSPVAAVSTAGAALPPPAPPVALAPAVIGDAAASSLAVPQSQAAAGQAAASAPEQATAAAPEQAAEAPLAAAESLDDEQLRVPGRIVDRLLDFAGEAVILLAQLQQRVAMMNETRAVLRAGADRLLDLSGELERLVDVRGLALTGRGRDQRFDALELDEYNDLHTVSRRIAEAGADNKLLDQQFDRQLDGLRDLSAQLERIQTDVREQAMRTRMVPVATITGRLQRAMRQAARMAGKRVSLDFRGEDTPLDGQLLQSLVDPLTHMLRNAVDHGIEPEAQRLRAGKPASGSITLSFRRDAATLVIELSDDGQGFDTVAIRQRAVSLGLIDGQAAPSAAELIRMSLLPGFSTRREATQLSGRGIGLNVVHQRLQELRGKIDIRSQPGKGSWFELTLPLRMAAVPVMVVRCATHVLALSVRDIETIASIDELFDAGDGSDMPLRVRCGGEVYSATRLEALLHLPVNTFASETGQDVALLVRDGPDRCAVIAPPLGQTRNVILRPLPALVPAIGGIGGMAVLGDGSVAPVIDLPELIAHRHDVFTQYAQALASHVDTRPVCLVVDDSVSVRRSMELFLRDLGLQVDSAGDGLEALACIERRVPQLVIADLEMPRMNGVELTAALRANASTARVPVIMITSRYSDKHKNAAVSAGVDVFMTKPYTEDELAGHIQRTLFRQLG